MRKKTNVVLITTVLALTILQGLAASPAYSKDPPSWAMKIVRNVTISGLTRPEEGERQEVKYLGKGSWSDDVNDVWYFVVWRLRRPEGSGWERDLQAHIELAKIRDGVYWMEICYSWGKDRLSVDMPYDYEVLKRQPHFLKLNITTDF